MTMLDSPSAPPRPRPVRQVPLPVVTAVLTALVLGAWNTWHSQGPTLLIALQLAIAAILAITSTLGEWIERHKPTTSCPTCGHQINRR